MGIAIATISVLRSAAQERERREHGEQRADRDVHRHVVGRSLDEARDVAGHDQRHTGGSAARELGDGFLDGPRNGHGVAARLAAHVERDALHAVELGVRALVLHAVLDARDVAHERRRAVAKGDHDLARTRGRVATSPLVLNEILGAPGLGLEPSAGQLGVLAAHGLDHVVHGERVAAQAIRIEPDPHLALAATDERDGADAGNALDPLLHDVVGVIREVADRQRSGDHDRENRRSGRVDLLDERRLDVERQLRARARDLVAHVLRLLLDVLLELELDGDLRKPLGADRAQRVDAGDRVDLFLERIRDFALDRLRRRARQRGHDRDERELDPGH